MTRVASRLSLRADTIKLRLQKYGPAVHSEAEKLYATINADAAKQRERLEEMLKTFPAGDVRRGQVVFMRDRKSTRLNSSHERLSRMPSSA